MAKKQKKYWSTLEEYYNASEVEKLRGEEFFDKPENSWKNDDGPRNFNRRDFMKLGGAAAIFSMIACGSRPVEKIVPYAKQPEEIVLGQPNYYASTCFECPAACGLVVKTREGRPIKMEGNPDHPVNRGKLCSRGQASLLNLYDPARLRFPYKVGAGGELIEVKFEDADQFVIGKLKNLKGQLVILTGACQGPARTALMKQFLNIFPNSRHIKYETLTDDAYRQSRLAAYGSDKLPNYHFDRAETLVLLGADPFGNGRSRVKHIREITALRKPAEKRMSKIYAFEPSISETGSYADHRYPVTPSQLYKIAGALVNQIVIKDKHSKYANDNTVLNAFKSFEPEKIESELHLEHGVIAEIAQKLWQDRGKSLVMSESFSNQFENAEKLHLTVSLLNSMLENEGVTLETSSVSDTSGVASNTEIRLLIDDMKAGRVGAIIIAGTNPAFTLPDSLGFAEALKSVDLKISCSDRADETAKLCDYILTGVHSAEGWGDAEPLRGLYAIQQPTITPLWINRQFEDTLLILIYGLGIKEFGSEETGAMKFYDYLRNYWKDNIYARHNLAADFEDFWVTVLQTGVFESDVYKNIKPESSEYKTPALAAIRLEDSRTDSLELSLTASSLHWDGRSMNNAWLLETPDPVTKITWDNCLTVAPSRAKDMNLKEGDVVKLTAATGSLELPVHIAPGNQADSVTVTVGWGRQAVGDLGNGIGVDTFRLAGLSKTGFVFGFNDVKIEKTDKIIPLADVQGHHYLANRPIFHEGTFEEYLENPHSWNKHAEHSERKSLWKQDHRYPGHKWGMAIDLNSCMGCNACVTACQVENNISVVGKDQVLRGREMHWMRIDRYYTGEDDNPEVIRMPMLCQHCDKAPCETVCPVLATVHNDEGLNLQVYNRCVGTRYCSNNCPYKVRRFNYYDYYKKLADEKPLQMLLNPDVTVRTRGVMEKCTFCIQRIRGAHHEAKKKGRPIADGEITTACEQTCPANAITFGDLNDPESRISKLAHSDRAYKVLDELNNEPNISYQALIRNKKKTEEDESEEHGSHES